MYLSEGILWSSHHDFSYIIYIFMCVSFLVLFLVSVPYHVCRKKEKEIDGQRGRQKDRTERRNEVMKERQKDKRDAANKQAHAQWMDEWMDGWMVCWLVGCTPNKKPKKNMCTRLSSTSKLAKHPHISVRYPRAEAGCLGAALAGACCRLG